MAARFDSLIGLLEEGVDSVVARSLYVDCNQKRVNVRPTLINKARQLAKTTERFIGSLHPGVAMGAH